MELEPETKKVDADENEGLESPPFPRFLIERSAPKKEGEWNPLCCKGCRAKCSTQIWDIKKLQSARFPKGKKPGVTRINVRCLQPDKKSVEIINIGRAERPETQCLCGFQPFVCVAQLDRATAS